MLLIIEVCFSAFAWAVGLSVPVAWIRVRHAESWRQRPKSASNFALLAEFSVKVIVLAVAWGAALGTGIIIGTGL